MSGSVQLPTASVNTTPPPVTGQIIDVNSGGDLQAAINAAQPGDEIVLQAGATFTGPITLPNFSGSGWITITSSGAGALTPGVQVNPNEASDMATIAAPGSNEPALQTAPGAHNYYISGLNITAASSVTQMTSLVNLGSGNSDQNTVAQEPSNIIIDRSYIHGSATLTLTRAISLQSASTAIINSYISDVHSASQDTQAIAGWNGSGPYLIQNNFLEASGENVLFGGADPSIPNLIPSDITIQNNDFYKDPSWQSLGYDVKNLFELKNADRVLVQNNTFENNWVNAQAGYAILFQSVNQGGTAPWSQVANVTFQRNVVLNSPNGINICATQLGTGATPAANININNNLLYNIGTASGGTLFQVLGYGGSLSNLSITNNTGILSATAPTSGSAVMFDGNPTNGFTFNNNVLSNGDYGIIGTNYSSGNPTLAYYAPGGSYSGNVLIGGLASQYSSYPGNYFPSSVSFVDPSTGNYNLANPSLYDNGNAGDQYIGGDPPPAQAAPTVTITSAGLTTNSAAQTIAGTVDTADAGSTVTVLDGTTKIGSATVGAGGAWSANVTLANQGANVLTATDTNVAGTGTSNAITDTLNSASTAAPTVPIEYSTLYVSPGGTIGLGISEQAPQNATATTVTITGLPSYETLSDASDGKTYSGNSITLSETQVNSGVWLTSHYQGTGLPKATLTITGSDTIGGVTSVSAPETITVVDPPASKSTPGANSLASELITFKRTHEAGWAGTADPPGLAKISSDLAALLTSHGSVGSYDWSPAAGETHLLSGLNIAAFDGLKAGSALLGRSSGGLV